MDKDLTTVYEHFRSWVDAHDEGAKDYFDFHGDWRTKFSRKSIPNWLNARREDLQDLIFSPGGYISALGNAMLCMGSEKYDNRWKDEQSYREICADIQKPKVGDREGVCEIVPLLRGKFYTTIGFNAEVVFNRVLAGLRIDLTVPVIDTARAMKLRQWLGANDMLVIPPDPPILDWFDISHQIRDSLYRTMPVVSASDRSVFAWFLAECLDDVHSPRLAVLRRELKQAMLLP